MDDRKLALLVRQAIKGDMNAFEEVYFANARSVLFHVRNQVIDKENYQDVAQDVAIAMWKNIKQLRKPKAFRGWMHQVIRTTCASHNRALLKERARQSNDDVEEAIDEIPTKLADENGNPALIAAQKDDQHRLFVAIESLPPAYRDSIVLRYYDDLSYKEIAKALDITTSSVGTNILRGTERLKQMLNETMSTKSLNELQINDSLYEKPAEERQALSHERRDMNGKNGIKAGAAVAGALVVDDEAIKSSLISGIDELLPQTAVHDHTKEVHLGLLKVEGMASTATATTTATVTAGSVGGNTLITIATSIMAVSAIGLGTYGLFSTNQPVVDPLESTEANIETTIQYQGDPHIIFSTAKGSDVPYGVVAILVEDAKVMPATVSWTITSSEGAPVLEGSGSQIEEDAGLADLVPGEYKVNFVLTDDWGAQALSSRTFTIEHEGTEG